MDFFRILIIVKTNIMADIQSNSSATHGKSISRRSTRVDLTPMVDLGFLLITFFVFTSSMKQPTVMQVVMPYDKVKDPTPVCTSCVLTVMLDKDDRILYYEGALENHPVVKETGYSADGIRKVLVEKKHAVQLARGRADAFILIIKPSDESNFKNFVDMVDEVTINNIKRYYMDELSNADKQLLAAQKPVLQ